MPQSKVNPLVYVLPGALLLGSLVMIGSGFYGQQWVAALGVVLFMTSLIAIVGLSVPPAPIAQDSKPALQKRSA
ncbi:MAG: hypothetical protein P4M08_14580 [Oligoflexia bacterium]|nr:hypothetical protein [Oligoflexia bacterium]